MTPAPSPEAQLAFLVKLQRLFAEGDFTATYKFALLIAMADLAVERGQDSGDELALAMIDLAEKFVELYWQQTAPYASPRAGVVPAILAQNNGPQAAVLTAIGDFRSLTGASTVQAARSSSDYRQLVQRVARTVADQPVRYLQNLGGRPEVFLYDRVRGGIVLLPGVAYCLRRFQPLVQQLSRTHWVAHVKRNRLNLPVLGAADDLASFLFETPRQALAVIGAGLRKLSNGRCLYCAARVDEADIDHFIPFALYPRDLIHNFVFAHSACNRSKSDTLAARRHLEAWHAFVERNDDDLRELGKDSGRVIDADACRAVARWGYSNAAAAGAQAWVRPGQYEAVESNYLDVLL